MRFAAKAIVFLLLSSLPITVLAGPLAVPPDSFINQHVDSVPHLARQVTLDPVVRRRLARHFHLSGPAMIHYIQNDLVLKTLPSARRFPVYCISPSGHEYALMARLPAGTPVFALRGTGQPILKLICGNPLVSALPSEKTAPPRLARTSPKIAALSFPAAPSPKLALAPNAPIVFVLASTGQEILPASALPMVRVADYPIGPMSHASSASYVSAGASPFGFLAGLPFLDNILERARSGSNASSTVTPGTSTGTPGGNTVTSATLTANAAPEPSQYALLGLFVFGAATLALRSRLGKQTR